MKAKKYLAKLYAFQKNITKNGEVALYISITIARQNKFIPLKLKWPADFFDFQVQQLKKRKPRDEAFRDYNLIIQKKIGICNEIFVQYRLKDEELSMDTFLTEFYQFNLRKDFKSYMEDKIKRRYKRGEITSQTKKNHTNSLNKIKHWHRKPLPFSEVTVKWCREFEQHLRKKLRLKLSSAWGHMKDVNTYLNMAKVEDNIPLSNPFSNGYSITTGDSETNSLSQDQLKELHKYYYGNSIPENEKYVLRQFLFSCFTGLRISDIKAITDENLIGDMLVFHPVKTQRFSKILKIPLSNSAKKFISEEVSGKLFPRFTDQACNRILKRIQEACNIPFRLTNHVGRHSFATLFLELGGSVEVLQKLMGHSKIATTMRYVHIQEARKQEQVANFDKLKF